MLLRAALPRGLNAERGSFRAGWRRGAPSRGKNSPLHISRCVLEQVFSDAMVFRVRGMQQRVHELHPATPHCAAVDVKSWRARRESRERKLV